MRATVSLMCVALFGSLLMCGASQVIPEKLDAMIGSVRVIVVGTVLSAERAQQSNRHAFRVQVNEVLVGEVKERDLMVNYFEQGAPGVSVTVPSSGLETSLKKGQRCIFLFETVEVQRTLGIVLTRAEPENRRDEVIAAWKTAHPSVGQ